MAAAQQQLAAIAAVGDAKARTAAYAAFIDAAVSAGDGGALKAAADALADEGTPLAVARPALRHLGETVNVALRDNATAEDVCTHALAQLAARGVEAFEEADYHLRWPLFAIYVADEDYLRAATTLAAARLDGGAFDDATRAAAFVKVAQNAYKGGDEVMADRFMKRAGEYVHRAGDPVLLMQWRTLGAVVADSKRRFADAAGAYIAVVREAGDAVEEAEAVGLLDKAAVCAILAPAGPQRTRLLGALLRDERTARVRPPVHAMLTRVAHERLVPPSEAAAFEGALEPHQRALTSDGTSVVARALVEHNLHAAGRLYSSVTFDRLGELLGVSPAAAERTAARMVSERRLAAALDQVGGFVDFTAGGGGGAGGRLAAWDSGVAEACAGLAGAAEAVVAKHPHLAPA
jgi:COP9 signalosome complex subunit 4